jgi:flagellar basal body-associated protein FliL
LKVANNVTKYRKRKDVNIAYIVFLIIFIYVVTYVCIYFTKEHLSIYEVKEGYTADNNTFNGLILRNEEIVTSDRAGYINYYHRDSDRVGKNTIIYSLTDEKVTYDLNSEEEIPF